MVPYGSQRNDYVKRCSVRWKGKVDRVPLPYQRVARKRARREVTAAIEEQLAAHQEILDEEHTEYLRELREMYEAEERFAARMLDDWLDYKFDTLYADDDEYFAYHEKDGYFR